MPYETQTQLQPQNQTPPIPDEGDDIAQLNIIRTETVLSKFPRHILSKSGKRPEIRIEKLTANGKLELRWYVSYNELYGPARQLAYDLDTLIIDRAIEETFEEARRSAQSLPRLIPIGSLRDICRKLDFEENGTNTAKIKKALQQNAGTVINAILSYRGNDGSEQTLDGTFTCYGVFFIGKKLPDGRKADQTYISTTNEYHQVVSSSPTRPLDYDYKAQLPPTPRRWYELASFVIYGALKNNLPTAKLLYSDYCDRAPHVRYFTFDQVKKQMYKVHRPHLQSGYITKISYDQTTDEQGRPDWIMHYVPGPKARSDHAIITGKKIRAPAPTDQKFRAGETRTRRPRQRHLNLKPAADQQQPIKSSPSLPEVNFDEVAALTVRGISEQAARKLVAELPTGFPVLDTLEWADQQIASQRGKINNPPGFYISLLRDRITPPPTFETSRQYAARSEADLARQQKFEEQQAAATRLEEALRQKAEEQLNKLSPEEYQTLYTEVAADYFEQYPNQKIYADRDMTQAVIRRRMRERIQLRLEAGESTPFPDVKKILSTLQLPAPRQAKATGLASAPIIKSTVL